MWKNPFNLAYVTKYMSYTDKQYAISIILVKYVTTNDQISSFKHGRLTLCILRNALCIQFKSSGTEKYLSVLRNKLRYTCTIVAVMGVGSQQKTSVQFTSFIGEHPPERRHLSLYDSTHTHIPPSVGGDYLPENSAYAQVVHT